MTSTTDLNVILHWCTLMWTHELEYAVQLECKISTNRCGTCSVRTPECFIASCASNLFRSLYHNQSKISSIEPGEPSSAAFGPVGCGCGRKRTSWIRLRSRRILRHLFRNKCQLISAEMSSSGTIPVRSGSALTAI